ncbi:MAG: BamA/TamA family outer membrane protein [Saprospiraceae bacterium]|uniref:BamA/TamA family outer membrane protein n=1 Tax=Candidatus Defluviibacterium haderslevense TaxID=2981993 RepID=A0A9D7XHI1_9BACT|nr:BamA/TamA family outer membrane protein [Candidatus Defluviibacterium haderslevense]
MKQFYLGGPQSLRAWGIREPGPGADPISKTVDQTGTYYSAGDVKVEANIEFRFDLVWIFKGAFCGRWEYLVASP